MRLAAFPDGLARALVEQHLNPIFPLWYYRDHLAWRYAEIWQRQALAEATLHLLGLLAGLNRRYFSATQLKRTRALVAILPVAPPDLAARLERLLVTDVATATGLLEGLTGEVLALVKRELARGEHRREATAAEDARAAVGAVRAGGYAAATPGRAAVGWLFDLDQTLF